MAVYCQNNDFWSKVSEKNVVGNDIEKYIHSSEHLSVQNPLDYCKIKNEYNTDLICYFFETEKYQNEEDYEEIFFQGLLDKEIEPKEYYDAENSFIKLIDILSGKSKVYVYYNLLAPTEVNYPLKKSDDVNFDINFIKNSEEKFIEITDESQLCQIGVLLAREIIGGYIVFSNIKSVLTCSGMHGYIFSLNELEPELLNDISMQVKINKISF